MLEINSVISLLSAVITFTLGLYVYARKTDGLLNKVFLLLNIAQSIYSYSFYELAINSTSALSGFWLIVQNLWPFILALLTHVVLIYTGYKGLYKNIKVIVSLYLFTVAITSFFIGGIIETSIVNDYWGIKQVIAPSPVFMVYITCLTIVEILVIILLAYHLKIQKSAFERVKARFVLIGFLMLWFAGSLTFLLTEVLKLNVPSLIIPSLAAEAIIIGYAVLKYELFVIRPETLTQEIVNKTSDAIFLVNQNGQVIFANQSALKLAGREITGLSVRDLIGDEIAEKMINYAKYGLDKGGCICESGIKAAGSGIIPVNMTISVIKDSMNEVKGFVCIARDISEKYKLIDGIAEKERNYKAVFNLSPNTIILLDKDGRILDISKRFLDLYKISPQDISGKSIDDLEFLPEGTKSLVHSKIAEISPEKISLKPFDIEFINRKNEHRIGEVYTSLLTDEYNTKLGILAIVTDVTDKRLSELKLMEAKEEIMLALTREKELSDLKSRFISLISHEYRTPLTIILSSSSLIYRYYKLGDYIKMEEHIKKIQYAINSLVRMLENVVSVDTIGISKSQLKMSLVEAIGSIKSYINEVETVDNSMHPIEFYYSENKIIFDTEITLFRHIVFQLVNNCVKYSLPGKPVQVYLVNQENFLEITITDQGIGIPLEYREHEFEPFYRCSNVGTISGIGLGLSIVKKSTDLLSGKISYFSEVNKGTTFTVILPKQYTMDYY